MMNKGKYNNLIVWALSLILGIFIGAFVCWYFMYFSWRNFWLHGIASNASIAVHSVKLLDEGKNEDLRSFMLNFAKQNIDIASVYLGNKDNKCPYRAQINASRDFIEQANQNRQTGKKSDTK